MLTHERRLSALGPGGLNRKRAGFEVRDVHISHYGRICPIETPEGTNIGLISVRWPSMPASTTMDFLVTPYRGQERQADWTKSSLAACGSKRRTPTWHRPTPKVTGDIDARLAGQEHRRPLSTLRLSDWCFRMKFEYIDVAPSQMVGVSAGLIPFLEHDDANRALMGSNMQRQAVPLLVAEPPLVGTGMEAKDR